MKPLTRENFSELGFTVTGGAWGTEIMRRGAGLGVCLPEWNLHSPQVIVEIAASYAQAGSGIVLTNTFLADPISLARHGLENQFEAINAGGVYLCRQAMEERGYVFGSIGPIATAVKASGSLAEMLDVAAAYAAQARMLEQSGADAVVIESLTDLSEAEIAARAAVDATSLPVGITFSFHGGMNNDRIPSGNTAREISERLNGSGISFIGANCGVGIEPVEAIAMEFMASMKLPVWIKPNAMTPDSTVFDDNDPISPEKFAEVAGRLRGIGVRFIGGCCGVGAEHIKLIGS